MKEMPYYGESKEWNGMLAGREGPDRTFMGRSQSDTANPLKLYAKMFLTELLLEGCTLKSCL